MVILSKYVKNAHKVQTRVNGYIIAIENKKYNLINATNRIYIYKKEKVYLITKYAN